MPAKSQAQRAYLNATKGHAWVKKHHFDNKGKLPAHFGKDNDKPVVAKALYPKKKKAKYKNGYGGHPCCGHSPCTC